MTPFQKFKQFLLKYGLEYFGLFYGVYRGTVMDNEDPEQLGRLKISCPIISGDETIDYWAWPKAPYAGAGIGFFFIPQIGDGIYIEFEGGNPKYPIWSGGWWAQPESATEVPAAAQVTPPDNKVLQTAAGHKIEMDDTAGAEAIRITDKAGSVVTLDSVTGKVTVQAIAGIDLDGGSGNPLGVVTNASICHFTGIPHADPSLDVKASKGV